MIVAIMQPYFFPYIGYFQLMAAVDTFVFLDDVQYVDRSWMNRNRIRIGNRAVWLSMPVRAGSRKATIAGRAYVGGDAFSMVERKIEAAYRNAPYFHEFRRIVCGLERHPQESVAAFNISLLKEVCSLIGKSPKVLRSSSIRGRADPGQRGILQVCAAVGASCYINAIGGVSLYSRRDFERQGIALKFLRTRVPPVWLEQGEEHLSIIDSLMQQGIESCGAMLQDYDLLTACESAGQASGGR